MLIETDEGVLNTDHILTAAHVPDLPGRCAVRFADGTTQTVGIAMIALARACGVIVPAEPGFVVVHAILPDNAEEGIIYGEEPVIAFRVGHGGEHDGPMPITVSGEPLAVGGGPWTIQQPNGACSGPAHAHDDLAGFKAECERAATARLSALASA